MRHHGRLASSVLGLLSTAVCASEFDETGVFGSPEHHLLDGSGGGTSGGGGSSSSGGTFQQDLTSSVTAELKVSVTVSTCTSGNWIHCQTNVFDNTTNIAGEYDLLAVYNTWATCAVSPPFSMLSSATVPCTSGHLIVGAIYCEDIKTALFLTADASNTVSATCL